MLGASAEWTRTSLAGRENADRVSEIGGFGFNRHDGRNANAGSDRGGKAGKTVGSRGKRRKVGRKGELPMIPGRRKENDFASGGERLERGKAVVRHDEIKQA
jgi:hypothetical protein